MEINILIGLVVATIAGLVILSIAVRRSLESLHDFKKNLTDLLGYEEAGKFWGVLKYRSNALDSLQAQIKDLNCYLPEIREFRNVFEEKDLLENLRDVAWFGLHCDILEHSFEYQELKAQEFLEENGKVSTSGFRLVDTEVHEVLYELVDSSENILLQETNLYVLRNKMNVLIEAKINEEN